MPTLRYLIMKTNIFTLACMMLMMLMLPACSTPSAEDVLKKHSEGKELTQKDYEVATAYAADAVAEFSEMVRADKGDPAKMMADAEELEKKYPDAICSLNAMNPLQLLIATRLSAQCTDARVNLVTPALFEKYKTAEDFAAAAPEEVEALIRSCGFFRTKARDIIGMCRKIIDDFGGKVPDSIEALTSLPGVGRKTANLIMGDVYGEPAVVADTHLIRISNLLGLVSTKDPYKVEMRLRELLPPEKSNDFCHRCVLHGRDTCVAGRPKCGECVMSGFCAKVLSDK